MIGQFETDPERIKEVNAAIEVLADTFHITCVGMDREIAIQAVVAVAAAVVQSWAPHEQRGSALIKASDYFVDLAAAYTVAPKNDG